MYIAARQKQIYLTTTMDPTNLKLRGKSLLTLLFSFCFISIFQTNAHCNLKEQVALAIQRKYSFDMLKKIRKSRLKTVKFTKNVCLGGKSCHQSIHSL